MVERVNNIVSERLTCLQSDCLSLEEADNHIVLHIRNAILFRNRSRIMVRMKDSDVVVILVAFMCQFMEYSLHTKIWADFGSGTDKRTLFINGCFDY